MWSSKMCWLPVIFLFLGSCTFGDPVDPASPAFVFPQGVDPQGAQANDLRQAFKDAIVIARMAAMTMNPYCDPVSHSSLSSEDLAALHTW